jgi:indole-3-glycerol phosphate synthase
MTILDTIVRDSAGNLSRRKRECPISSLESMAGFARSPLPFAHALKSKPGAFIAEIKHRSPSKGVLRDDYDVKRFTEAYQTGGARAISVLTEENHFHGHLAHLETARSIVSVPLLRKDFIVDPYQIIEARAFGADAVLLIVSLLDRHHLEELLAVATEVNLDCLVEIYDEPELDRVDFSRISILGVNNRNLHSFEVDTSRAPRILARVPEHIARVAESGLKTAENVADMFESGIDAVLIGEALMSDPDPGEALSALRESCDKILADREHVAFSESVRKRS